MNETIKKALPKALPLQVGLIGHGAIGSVVANELEAGVVNGAKLKGVLDPLAPHPSLAVANIEELLAGCDLVVEAAGHDALKQYSHKVLTAGVDLLVVSVGALADKELYGKITEARQPSNTLQTARLYFTTGAVGGFDTLRAAALFGDFKKVEMTSKKPAQNLLMDWMDEDLKAALSGSVDSPATDTEITAFSGTARDACRLFPQSANVCATVSLATVGFDETQVNMIGCGRCQSVRHEIKVEAESGSYEFAFENATSPINPKTSAIVPFAVLRGIQSLVEGQSQAEGQSPTEGQRFI